MPTRQFTPFELNQLRKYGLFSLNPTSVGETPVEYLTGHAEFFKLDFQVSPAVLIPRLESEQLVTMANNFLTALPPRHLDIADIGTGSGCLGISLAQLLASQSFSDFDLWLSDLSTSALFLAQINATTLLPNTKQLHFLESDLLSNYPPQKFDLILANLPYIPSTRISDLDSSVKDYEPSLALDGGPNGIAIINRFLSSVEKFLKPVSQIILEIDTFQELNQFTLPPKFQAKIVNDCFDRPRFLVVFPV